MMSREYTTMCILRDALHEHLNTTGTKPCPHTEGPMPIKMCEEFARVCLDALRSAGFFSADAQPDIGWHEYDSNPIDAEARAAKRVDSTPPRKPPRGSDGHVG